MHRWHVALKLLLAGLLGMGLSWAQAASVVLAEASPQRLSVTITPDAGETGTRNVYIGAFWNGELYLRGPTTRDWRAYPGGAFPVAQTISAAGAAPVGVTVVDFDVAPYAGVEVYVGYGANEAELELPGHLAKVYPAASPSPWTQFLGVHYSARSWARSVRDPGGPGSIGYNASDAAGSLATFHATLERSVVPLLPTHHLVLAAGGLGSGRDQDAVSAFMNSVRNGGAAAFRDGMLQRARAVAERGASTARLWWQFGNEINSQRFSETLHGWAGDGVAGRANDTSTIGWLVESFLAPGAEGVRQASQEVYGDPGRIRVMLGSVSGAVNANAQTFLAALLDYPIVGTYAPSLKGRTVREVIDTISIHYAVGTAGTAWRSYLDGLRTTRIGQGAVTAIVSTEEVGQGAANSGQGMGAAMRVLSRYLDWWLLNGIGPDQGHLFIYGPDIGPPGTRIDELMPTVYNFLGDTPLARTTARATVGGSASIESYEFEVVGQRRRLISLFAPDTAAVTVSSVTLDATGWASLGATVLLYTDTGVRTLLASVASPLNGKYQVSFGTQTLEPRQALVLLVQE